jgi:hypothetical protein
MSSTGCCAPPAASSGGGSSGAAAPQPALRLGVPAWRSRPLARALAEAARLALGVQRGVEGSGLDPARVVAAGLVALSVYHFILVAWTRE